MISPRELFFIGAALGWVIAALCFMFIPSWRARDIRKLSDAELLTTVDQAIAVMQSRCFTTDQIENLEHARYIAVACFPPHERREVRRTPP